MALSYTTVDRMLGQFPRISDVAAVSSEQLAQYAEYAESEINGKIAGRYTVPVSGSPPLLVMIATDLAIYRTLALRFFTGERLNESPWPDRYKESAAMLDRIAEGDIPLVDSSGSAITESTTAVGEVWSSKQAYLPTFGEFDPRVGRVDPDKVEDEMDDRGITRYRVWP